MLTFNVDKDHKTCTCELTKRKCTLTIEPHPRGYGLYVIRSSKTHLPLELKGSFSSMESAQETISKFDKYAKESDTVKRDILREQRENRKRARNAPATATESSQHLHQRSDN